MKQTMYVLAILMLAGRVALASDLPTPTQTPGDTVAVPQELLCKSKYTACVRSVTEATKKVVVKAYGIADYNGTNYEIDHLISLELGGSNSAKNLWPQSYVTTPWNARIKDTLENKLSEMVCSNQISLADAQQAIRTNWVDAYRKYGGSGAPQGRSKISSEECAQVQKLFGE